MYCRSAHNENKKPHNGLRFFADCAAKKWPLRGSGLSGIENGRSQKLHPTAACVQLRDMPDSWNDRFADLPTGSCDCVDRIVLNAYFRMGHDPEGSVYGGVP